MFDIWGFLVQTLNVSGAAMVLLLIKELFRDKLPPKWHFAVWGIWGIILLIPAGLDGRYALFHWPFLVEIIKSWCGDYGFTQILLPIPIIFVENVGADLFSTVSRELILGWIFVGYVLGVVMNGLKYIVSYIRLRIVLRDGQEVSEEKWEHIHQLAWRYFGTEYLGTKKFGTKRFELGKVVEIQGLPSAFVCGILRPILVLPEDEVVDDKIILHELSHMKYKDTFWTVIICFWKCIHWCNPFLAYCANRALNDMEARCDQQVLELLEGEERRDYGRILLSMTNEKYAQTPGSTCINNGGKNIRERIEAIARFKKYPAGMRLVSRCVIVLLTIFLAIGGQTTKAYEFDTSIELSMASARSIPCTTVAGAFDTYAKAILEHNGYYRAMCAPQSMQEELLQAVMENEQSGIYPEWNNDLSSWANSQKGYYIFNLMLVGKNVYEGVLVVELNYPPDGTAEKENMVYLAYQKLQVEKENGRWVVEPMEGFQYLESPEVNVHLRWGHEGLPGIFYTATVGDMQVNVNYQTIHMVDNTVQGENNWMFGSNSYFDTVPKTNAVFTEGYTEYHSGCTHLGTQEERDTITQIGLVVEPVYEGEERPDDLPEAVSGNIVTSNNSTGRSMGTEWTEPGWGPTIWLSACGVSRTNRFGMPTQELPVSYAADLYVNNKLVEKLDLYVQEGVSAE